MKELKVLGSINPALVDDEDFERLSRFNWTLDHGHARRSPEGGKGHVYMHDEVIDKSGYKPGLMVDHKNRNRLDNQKDNLRYVTLAQNNQNKARGTSKYLGVCWNEKTGRWLARAYLNRRCYYIGIFHSQEDAALAYDAKARELFGEKATLNFPSVVLAPATNLPDLSLVTTVPPNGRSRRKTSDRE